MKKLNGLLLVFALGVFTQAGFAQSVGEGITGAQELLIPVGARNIGLSGASISTIRGTEAIYSNPAGVGNLSGGQSEILFFSGDYLGGLKNKVVGGAFSFGDIGVFFISLKNLDFGQIEVTTDSQTEGTGETYSPFYLISSFGYANQLSEKVSAGVSIQVIQEKIHLVSALGVGFDAGIQVQNIANIENLSLGVVLKNLGPQMKFSGTGMARPAIEMDMIRGETKLHSDAQPFGLPVVFQMGLGYQYSPMELHSLQISTVFEEFNQGADSYQVGVEYAFDHLLFIRGGHVFVPDLTGDAYAYTYSLGFGLHYDLGYFKVKLDYAFRDSKNFGGLNHIGVQLGF